MSSKQHHLNTFNSYSGGLLRPAGVPAIAVMITYKPTGKSKTEYYVWEGATHWYWYAQGSNGQANTRETAEWMCRNWIDKGLAGRAR